MAKQTVHKSLVQMSRPLHPLHHQRNPHPLGKTPVMFSRAGGGPQEHLQPSRMRQPRVLQAYALQPLSPDDMHFIICVLVLYGQYHSKTKRNYSSREGNNKGPEHVLISLILGGRGVVRALRL